MTQAVTIVSFPVDDRTTDFLKDAIGTPTHKLGAVATRLEGLEALVSMAKADAYTTAPHLGRAFFAIEQSLHDCLGLIDAEPVR